VYEMVTKRDTAARLLETPDRSEREVRAVLCLVVRTCSRAGVERLRSVVLEEEPVFYVDEEPGR
jgi:hypothetical protein